MIKKALGYQTEDGSMFASLNEAAGHSFGQRIWETLQNMGKPSSGFFDVETILKNSRELETILREYNDVLDRLDKDGPT